MSAETVDGACFCGEVRFEVESATRLDEIDVSVANLLNGGGLRPEGHTYADRSPEWCPIVDDLPRYGGAPGTEPLGSTGSRSG